jgi:hypothetical protein
MIPDVHPNAMLTSEDTKPLAPGPEAVRNLYKLLPD